MGLSNTVFQWTNRNAGTKLSCSSEPVFVNLLRSPRIDSQPCRLVRQPNLICRTGPSSYIGRRNQFLGFFKRLQIRALATYDPDTMRQSTDSHVQPAEGISHPLCSYFFGMYTCSMCFEYCSIF